MSLLGSKFGFPIESGELVPSASIPLSAQS